MYFLIAQLWISKLSEAHCLGIKSYSLVGEIIIIDQDLPQGGQDHFQGGGGFAPLAPPPPPRLKNPDINNVHIHVCTCTL
jgi:hypothetical protein